MRRQLLMLAAAVAAFAFPIPGWAADTLELRTGDRIRADRVEYDGREFRLHDTDVLAETDDRAWSRQDVRHLWFEKGGEAAAEDVADGAAEAPDAAVAAPADPADADWIEARRADAARLEALYPDVKGIVLLDDGSYELRADGTRVSRTRFTGKILKSSARDWGRVTVWFEEERQRVTILTARTILPDGRVIDLPGDAFQTAEPYRGLLFYNRNKVLAGELQQVAPGCIVDIEYEVETYNPFDPEMFFPAFLFRSTEPVARCRFEVVVPGGRDLFWRADRMPPGRGEPDRIDRDGRTRFTWEVTDMPPVISEPAMPAIEDVIPVVRASVFDDWEYILQWLRDAQAQRIVVTPEIEELAARLVDGAVDDDERIARLYTFLQREIRYVSIKGGIGSGFSGHRADETLNAGYGDCIDKAILFAALARAIGIRSDPIILLTNDRTDHLYSLPVLAGNHAISKIVLPDREFFLDATATTYRYPAFRADDQDAMCINAQAGRIERIDLRPAEGEGGTTIGELELAPTGDATVRYDLRFTGSPEAGIRWRVEHSKEEELERLFTEMVASYSPDARLVEVAPRNTLDLSQPMSIGLRFDLPGWGISAGDLMIVGVPGAKYRFREIALSEREYGIEYSTLNHQNHRVRMRLPAGYRVRSIPDPVALECAFGTYQSTYRSEDGTVVFEDGFRRTVRKVPADRYDEYRSFLRAIARASRERIFLEREDGSDGGGSRRGRRTGR